MTTKWLGSIITGRKEKPASPDASLGRASSVSKRRSMRSTSSKDDGVVPSFAPHSLVADSVQSVSKRRYERRQQSVPRSRPSGGESKSNSWGTRAASDRNWFRAGSSGPLTGLSIPRHATSDSPNSVGPSMSDRPSIDYRPTPVEAFTQAPQPVNLTPPSVKADKYSWGQEQMSNHVSAPPPAVPSSSYVPPPASLSSYVQPPASLPATSSMVSTYHKAAEEHVAPGGGSSTRTLHVPSPAEAPREAFPAHGPPSALTAPPLPPPPPPSQATMSSPVVPTQPSAMVSSPVPAVYPTPPTIPALPVILPASQFGRETSQTSSKGMSPAVSPPPSFLFSPEVQNGASASPADSTGSSGTVPASSHRQSRVGQVAASMAAAITSARSGRYSSPARSQMSQAPAPTAPHVASSSPRPYGGAHAPANVEAAQAAASFLTLPFSNGNKSRKLKDVKSLKGYRPGMTKESWAATRIQAAVRGYWARGALRALKSLVRLQALARGHIVRKQAATTLRCMYALVRIQARIRGRAVRKSKEGMAVQRRIAQLHIRKDRDQGAPSTSTNLVDLNVKRSESGWNTAPGTVAEQQARQRRKLEGLKRREMAYAYGTKHSQRNKLKAIQVQQKSMGFIDCDPDKGGWGWSWLECWQVARPWENRLMMSHHYKWVQTQGSLSAGASRHSHSLEPAFKHLQIGSACRNCSRKITARTIRASEDPRFNDLCNVCTPTISWRSKMAYGIPPPPHGARSEEVSPSLASEQVSPAKPPARHHVAAKAPAPALPAARHHENMSQRSVVQKSSNTRRPSAAPQNNSSDTNGQEAPRARVPRFMEMTTSANNKRASSAPRRAPDAPGSSLKGHSGSGAIDTRSSRRMSYPKVESDLGESRKALFADAA